MLEWIAKSRKAIGATVASAVAVYLTANADGTVTTEEWGLVAGALVVGVITYYTRNRKSGEVKDSGAA